MAAHSSSSFSVARVWRLWAGSVAVAAVCATAGLAAQKPLHIVGALTVYSDIARELAADGSDIESIAQARQDAHFVQGKPSYSMMLRDADLLISTGLDLELWLPAVLDRSRNASLREGQTGYVAVASGIPMLEVPKNPSRAAGDVHIYGNPHVHTDPLRAIMIAENIKTGLENVDPGGRSFYEQRFQDFKRKIHDHLFGKELVDLVGGDKLAALEMQHELRSFLESTQLGGASLVSRLGGWLKEAECLRGRKIVAYHLNWAYFLDRFGVEVPIYVERRPGIPPSAAHVADVVELMRRENIKVLWVANYFDKRVPQLVAERTSAKLLYVPLYTGDSDATKEYVGLVDAWITALRSGFQECQ